MDLMKLMVVALAGWMNQQQQDVSGIIRGLESRIIEPEFGSAEEGEVDYRQWLGGVLRYCCRDAA